MSDTRVLFFGVLTGHGAGHHLHAPRGSDYGWSLTYVASAQFLPSPIRLGGIDGVWCWSRPRTLAELRGPSYGRDETEGRGYRHSVEGWTVVSWWDRSEDPRGGCCAAFLINALVSWAEALTLARATFPREIARMESRYQIGLAGADISSAEIADRRRRAERRVEEARALLVEAERELAAAVETDDG